MRDTWLERKFQISARGSTVGTEVRGGLTTFMTMAYIVVLNPLILAGAADINGEQLDLTQVAGVTALVAAVMTLLMGLVGNVPIALAAGLGLNGVVAFQLAGQMSWEDAMGIVVIEGLVITFLVLVGFRERVFNIIPDGLKHAIPVGIGLFIAFIGLVDSGFVRRAEAGPVPVSFGVGGRLLGWPVVVFCVGLLLMAVLVAKKVPGGLLLGIVVTTGLAMAVNSAFDVAPQFGADGAYNPRGWGLNVPDWPDKVFDTPDLGLLGNFSLGGSFAEVGARSALLLIFTLMLADFFDTMGTVTGVGEQAGLVDDDGQLPNVKSVLLVDGLAAAAGGAASASSNTSYIESSAGVADGARTGLASVVTALCFGVALFFTPLVSVIPYEAASPALVVVGFLMMKQVKHIAWDDHELAIPAFLTIVLMPFTYSITNGIGAGFVSYVLLRSVNGKSRDTHWLLYLIAVAFVVNFAIEPVEELLGVK